MSRFSRAWRNSRLYHLLRAQRLPQALIIGAQKAGTSALFQYLSQHPRFAPSSLKEVSFFGSDLRFGYGLDWYAAQWDRKLPARAIHFEASPQYLFAEQAPGRIRACLPRVKLIAILRDPAERAYSAWNMYRSQLADDPDFYRDVIRTHFTPEEVARFDRRTVSEQEDFWLAIQREIRAIENGRSMEWSVVEFGLYGPQLKRYFDLFPREQLLVIDNADLRLSRVATLNRVLRFLGVPTYDWSQADLRDVFVGKPAPPMPERARDFLREYFRDSNRMLVDMLDDPPLFTRDEKYRRASA